MPKCLVVYYTRTGHTEQVANVLADMLGADIERIRETANRRGFWGYWRAGYESMRGILPSVEVPSRNPADYDVVILGTPVWSQRPSTPVRAFIAAYRDRFKSIACFCTLGGMGAQKTLAMMAELAGKPATGTFAVTEPELAAGSWKEGIRHFADAIREQAGTA